MAEDEEELEKLKQKAEKSDGKMKEIEKELSAAKVAFFHTFDKVHLTLPFFIPV